MSVPDIAAEPATMPKLYLLTPPVITPEVVDTLAGILDRHEVACLRLALAASGEEEVKRAVESVKPLAEDADLPIVIENHYRLVEPLGLHGVHLTDGSRSVRKARKALGAQAIVGASCGASRHEGLTAGEAGADYVSFGPVAETQLGTSEPAAIETFAWWHEIVELPVVAEGGLSHEHARHLAPLADFFAIGPEIWSAKDPIAALEAILRAAEEGVTAQLARSEPDSE